MAVIPLYRVKPHIRAPKWAKFPDDFDVVAETTIDDSLALHPEIASHKWNALPQGRKRETAKLRASRMAGRGSQRKPVLMHRVIWEIVNGPIPNGLTIDHKDLNPLNNRIENLRLASQSEQARNVSVSAESRSGYKCVYFESRWPDAPKPWVSYISPKGHQLFYLTRCATPEEAAFAYNVAASLYYGEFARLNDIPPDSVSPERQQEIRSIVEQKLQSRGLIPVS